LDGRSEVRWRFGKPRAKAATFWTAAMERSDFAAFRARGEVGLSE
jgi:hypothetical protein